jgi:hypothetical protein
LVSYEGIQRGGALGLDHGPKDYQSRKCNTRNLSGSKYVLCIFFIALQSRQYTSACRGPAVQRNVQTFARQETQTHSLPITDVYWPHLKKRRLLATTRSERQSHREKTALHPQQFQLDSTLQHVRSNIQC